MDATYSLPEPDFASHIAQALQLPLHKVQAAMRLLEEGNTIPFIARYRKEMTGELDENELRAIAGQSETRKALHARKIDVLRLLHEQGVLTQSPQGESLRSAIGHAQTMAEVDDLYRPYRPKRKTRASVARERGLAPLSTILRALAAQDADEGRLIAAAAPFVAPERDVPDADAALQGAADVIAEEVADDADIRKWVRALTWRKGTLTSIATSAETDSVYALYYAYEESLSRVVPHRILAINRGERDEYLRVSVKAPQEDILARLVRDQVLRDGKGKSDLSTPDVGGAQDGARKRLEAAVVDGYRRLIAPAMEREIRAELTVKAEEQAIRIFGENLRQLLLQPPLPGKTVLGVDPGFRTGCKLAVVDDTGRLLCVSVIYPTPPRSQVEAAKREVLRLFTAYGVNLIAIGNGTASRETETFMVECAKAYRDQSGAVIPYVMVSEAGASVYSASVLAGEEFPTLDVSERSAVSIARRLQDPLAELVKIDPKSIGVGQYQHDVSQKRLDEQLTTVVESAVNQVGIDVNTASASLLSYVAGLNKTAAKNIVAYREAHGRFVTRQALSAVPRLGQKTLLQAAGFLRITGGEEVLDKTPIHPESYDVVLRLLALTGVSRDVLAEPPKCLAWLADVRELDLQALCAQLDVGAPTLRDILAALERPGRDPREEAPMPVLRTDILKFEDLTIGMELTGTVRNVVDFGAFVDVGLKQDGLVHISQMTDRFIRHPLEVVAVGDIVQVHVIAIDAIRQRLGLSMRQ
ncbi:MAG: Tex family protein [Firmicutes bacterium]|nr:Tex family protein [Bacillota bacterium]